VYGGAFAESGNTYGGYFENFSTAGTGVYSVNTAASGPTYGGTFVSWSTDGKGVYGVAHANSGATCGGYFKSKSSNGKGIYGYVSSTTGINYGVYGQTDSPAGYGVYSQGNMKVEGTLDVNGAIYQRGSALHADYVFDDGYRLESIAEHSNYMWENKHLKAIPKAKVDKSGQEIVEVGGHQKGIVEELEKAHIYIEQLNTKNLELEAKNNELALKYKLLEDRLTGLEELLNTMAK
jgi:hypothetical protein